MIARRRRRRAGPDRRRHADRDRLGRARSPATASSYYLGRRLGREFLVRHGPRVQITPERLEQVERFFEQPRRQGDLHRPLRRPRPRDRAVPGRLGAHAVPALPARSTCSARGSGRRRSSCSATSSGTASTACCRSPSRARSALGHRHQRRRRARLDRTRHFREEREPRGGSSAAVDAQRSTAPRAARAAPGRRCGCAGRRASSSRG